jgi:ribonuclease P protein component
LKGVEPNRDRAGRLSLLQRVGNAVIRNRTRRTFARNFSQASTRNRDGIWIVTIASARAARGTFDTLEDEWLRLARRASIFVA